MGIEVFKTVSGSGENRNLCAILRYDNQALRHGLPVEFAPDSRDTPRFIYWTVDYGDRIINDEDSYRYRVIWINRLRSRFLLR